MMADIDSQTINDVSTCCKFTTEKQTMETISNEQKINKLVEITIFNELLI